jgi:hypothetical protein
MTGFTCPTNPTSAIFPQEILLTLMVTVLSKAPKNYTRYLKILQIELEY